MGSGEGCSHNCETCGENCSERTKESMIEKSHAKSNIKKVIGVVSGKGGVGNDIKYNEQSGKFACVSKGVLPTTIYGISVDMDYYYGITGHKDNDVIVIDNIIELDSDDSSAISNFWKQNWKED